MKEVSKAEVVERFHQLGIQAGDGLLVHSALQFLGKPQGGLGVYLDALDQILGPGGTLAAPTFNFSFAKGEDYDPETAPAVGMGAFSEFVRTQPGVLRTTHPMQSFTVRGKEAVVLAEADTLSAFDDGSAVDLMVRAGYKLLLLGANIQASSVFHYSEQRVGVPYRYWKTFSGRVRRDQVWKQVEYRMYVRDMEIDARLEIFEVEEMLKRREQWQAVKLNYGKIAVCTLGDFVQVTSDMLAEDPWRFVTNQPEVDG